MLSNRCVVTVVIVFLSSFSLDAATVTVAKDGSGNYTSIQEAINSAGAGDEIVILDTAVYEEQVTIDSTRSGLTLRSEYPLLSSKPVIRFQDTINVGPRDADEALVEEMITFDRNGALQVLGGKRIYIEGITVDGGGAYPFGYDAIWEGRYALQHGNAAIVLWEAGEVIIRHCDIRNAYFGISVKDRNEAGFYATPNPADIDTATIILFSGALQTGNHLIEYNRIHDNSFGLYFESMWDMGSTVRYNLVYENHHEDESMAATVKALTSEGNNQPGGAFMFKDHFLSPLAIYNNTFWHNALLFAGHWKTAPIHLIFNNIYAEPFKYWSDTEIFGEFMECSALYENRMHNCVYAALQQAPTEKYVTITNDMKPVMSPDTTFSEGALISPFPDEADIRWLETPFHSTDPENPLFLRPYWDEQVVRDYIIDQGWEQAGVRDPDGSVADLGAIPLNEGWVDDVVTIRPTQPMLVDGLSAKIGFDITPRIGKMDDMTLKMFGIVETEYDPLFSDDIFGATADPVPAGSISELRIGSYKAKTGINQLEIELPAAPGEFAFLEMIVEGTGSHGLSSTSSVGFLPYRKMDYLFDVTVSDNGGHEISEVQIGEPVTLHVESIRSNGTVFENTVDPTSIRFLSGYYVMNSAGEQVSGIDGGVTGSADVDIVFSEVPPGRFEHVSVAGIWIDGDKVVNFWGVSDAIRIVDPSRVRKAITPPVLSSARTTVECIDLKGRIVNRVAGSEKHRLSVSGGLMNTFGNGIYLIRQRNSVTGATTLQRRVVTGR
jgi:hypothetical protein